MAIVDNFGKPLVNLVVEVSYDNDAFEERENPDLAYQSAVTMARNLFLKPLHITENGYILADMQSGIEMQRAKLDVDDQKARMVMLDRLMHGLIESHQLGGIHLHGFPGGIGTIEYEAPHLRLQENIDDLLMR